MENFCRGSELYKLHKKVFLIFPDKMHPLLLFIILHSEMVHMLKVYRQYDIIQF